MPQIFHQSFNTISRLSILAVLALLFGSLTLLGAINRSDYATQVKVIKWQPVPFSHEHHVGALGIDCRYCHWTVETSSFANLPPTQVCMNCHSQIWRDSPMLEPVRESLRSGEPLRWTRVHVLPDFAFFDHSIHVAKGIGCSTCHGRIDRMPLTWKVESLQMEWCLDCHRSPELHLRPLDAVFDEDWEPLDREAGLRLLAERGIATFQLTDCNICHR